MGYNTALAADRADRFITLAALAIVVLGTAYGLAGLGRLLPEPQRAVASWLELVCAIGAVVLVVPGVFWKLRDPDRRGRFAAALKEGLPREIILRAAQIAWIATAIVLYLMHTFAQRIPESLPRETVVDFLLAFSLVAFGVAVLICNRTVAFNGDSMSA